MLLVHTFTSISISIFVAGEDTQVQLHAGKEEVEAVLALPGKDICGMHFVVMTKAEVAEMLGHLKARPATPACRPDGWSKETRDKVALEVAALR